MNRLFAFINPIVVVMARSILHRVLSHQVVVLDFSGRRSGRRYTIPVTYLRCDGEVLCMTERNGIWWRNLQGGVPVQLTLNGRSVSTISQVEIDDNQQIAGALRLFCLRSRISAYFAGVGFDSDGEPNSMDLVRAAERHVLITLTLT
ncbi:MAG: hypothetical protein CMP86_07255 [Gammaproteobacteria bacterium]|nr:hypothetical protein [Gammaproteobacteria bacterium]